MFEDKEWIKNIVNMRDEDEIVIPLYVQIYGKKYSLLELDTIKKRFSPSAFKIGYGTADALFMKNSFPTNRVRDFDVITVFMEYDSVNERQIRYMVFETGDVDVVEEDTLSKQIHTYFEVLFNNVQERVDAHFKALINTEFIPVIPKDPEPKKTETEDDMHMIDDSDDCDTDDDYLESDPLTELRREISEYSQDDEVEISSVDEDDIGDPTITSPIETNDSVYFDEITEYHGLVDGDNNPIELPAHGNPIIDIRDTDDEDYTTDFDIF